MQPTTAVEAWPRRGDRLISGRSPPRSGLSLSALLLLLLSLLLLLVGGNVAEASKLNVPKILLPYAGASQINYTLEAESGCYRWQSSRPEVASVEAVYSTDDAGQRCSSRAVVSARAAQHTRLTTIVIAEDTVSGQVLRCDVIVDTIQHIQIVSTTRELYLDDSPLELTIQAGDREGNTFTTLAGLQFDWTTIKDEEVLSTADGHNALRFLRFSEAAYRPPAYILEMERKGRQGDRMLVSGLKTGSARVKTKIREPLYKAVEATEVRLLILESILLSPSHDVYLLVNTHIHYHVLKVKQGRLIDIPMPSEQYELQLQGPLTKDGPVARLDAQTSILVAQNLGQTSLLLVHKNIRMQGVSRLPNSTVYVIEAAFLGFLIEPGEHWVLEVGREYWIRVEVFDKNGNRIHLTDNVRIETTFPKKFFNVLESNLNGSQHRVQALHRGQTEVKAILAHVLAPNGKSLALPQTISNQQEVEIFDPIVLQPPLLIYPWQPSRVHYHYTLKAEGGSGNFSWSSTETEVATVTVRGLLTTADAVGTSIIRARDVQNPLHFGSMKVRMLEVVHLAFGRSKLEARVGAVLELPVRASGLVDPATRQTKMFSDCSQMHFITDLANTAVFQVLEGNLPPGNGSCMTVRVRALSAGHTTISISYTHGTTHLHDSITIAAYLPLKVVDPISVALVTLGASKEVVFEGGPRPWVLEPSKFYARLDAQNEDLVTKHALGHGEQKWHQRHTFRVLCTALGEQALTLTVGNHESASNPLPAEEWTRTRFVCARPASLSLTPVYLPTSTGRPCPLTQQKRQLVPMSNHRDAQLLLVALDQQGEHFDNFSSLAVEWFSSDENLASFPESSTLLHFHEDQQQHGTGHALAYSVQRVTTHRKKGTVTIKVSASTYSDHLLRETLARKEDLTLPTVSASIELLLVEDVSISPNNLTIFNHPEAKVTLTLSEGSGFFHVNASGNDVMQINHQDVNNAVQVVPLQPGTLSLLVLDLCLALPSSARAEVRVSNIQELLIDVLDKVEIGKAVRAYVRVLDHQRKPFLTQFLRHMGLKLTSASNILNLEPLLEAPDDVSAAYLVHGLAVGQTTLTASARDRTGRKINAMPREIQVFPPFKLSPRKLVLLIGAKMQVMSEGGPQPQSNLVFRLENGTVARVGSAGHVTAETLGTTRLLGSIQATDPDMRKVVVFSQDAVDVEVVPLRGVRIHVPLTRIMTGSLMPVYVTGQGSGQTPFSFGSIRPAFTFHWSVSKRDVLELRGRHSEASLQLSERHSFSLVLRGRAQGRVVLKVTVRATDPKAGQFEGGVRELTDEVQIQVFEKLEITNPEGDTRQLLLSPKATFPLHTNRDAVSRVSYRVLDCPLGGSVVSVDEQGLVTACAATGVAIVAATAQEPFGLNQTAVIGVRVAAVAYVRVSVALPLYTLGREPLPYFPLGASLALVAHLHDNTGQVFHSASLALRYTLNRDDLAQVRPGSANNTFVAAVGGLGSTVLSVWDPDIPGLADFLPLPVGHAIGPADGLADVSLGDVICLSTALTAQDGSSGVWSSSDELLLFVDAHTGVAVAKDVGTVHIYYEITGLIKTYIEVVVQPLKNIRATYLGAMALTNWPKTEGVRVTVTLGSGGSNMKGQCSASQLQAMHVLPLASNLQCHTQFSNPEVTHVTTHAAFSVSPVFDVANGHYTCDVSPLPLADAGQQKSLSVAATSVHVWATVREASCGGDGVGCDGGNDGGGGVTAHGTAVAVVPFLPAFYVEPREVVLSGRHAAAMFTVHATEEALRYLEVSSNKPFVLVQRRSLGGNWVQFSVQLTDDSTALRHVNGEEAAGPMSEAVPVVSVSCSATGQRQELHVHLAVAGDATAAASLSSEPAREGSFQHLMKGHQNFLLILFLILLSFALVIIVYYSIVAPGQSVQHPAFLPRGASPLHNNSPAAPLSPWRSDSPESPASLRSSPNKRLWSTETADYLHRRS
ncbi:LOW QUALITY PROTEIN: nuclear pore membrane glycoprotein 210 [Lethenteron reissneri]|uniref:LOW QUALITY PROTEIN: nuclear pore membrane glycoprotein 210 n=1 Tax=Lethenteron reissneri TaxID=7753 RepID=UPI002AB6DAAC|nr:LOW QUALITY PROTEIN: nuclear pore membrane glycoprotein 210 [Lethenteron reissneri]